MPGSWRRQPRAVSIAVTVEDRLGSLGNAAKPVDVVAVTVALAYVTLVFGELAPKRMAMQRPERWALVAARPLALLSTLSRPAVWLLSASTDVAVRLMGFDPTHRRDDVTEEELRDMVAAQKTFTSRQRVIIEGAFDLSRRTLRQVLRPRRDAFVLDADEPATSALARLAASGYTRAPVGERGGLDDVIGLVHLRDLLITKDGPTRDAVTEPCPVLSESAQVLDALHELQARHTKMAIVVDEYGGASGIVTAEDLVEELPGNTNVPSSRRRTAMTSRSLASWLPGPRSRRPRHRAPS